CADPRPALSSCAMAPPGTAAGASKGVQAAPPSTAADGNPARTRGLNIVGLQRAGFTREQMRAIRVAFRKVYRSGLNNAQAVEELRSGPLTAEAAVFTDFVSTTKRGITPGSKAGVEDGED
ncbi:MAG TPA: hypothetical protein DCP71_16200, partial [Verrucomicrobiales bacterium]|nr:hypothetical protein [Verrucomicrobiales bacterium]